MAGQKRSRTRYTGIYLNENTKKYDIKYNYTIYNPLKGENEHKSKWVYGVTSLAEARQKLATLRAGGVKEEDKDVTLQGAFELWKQELVATENGSPVTVRNTEQQLRMLSQFIPLDTKVNDITEDVYLNLCSSLRTYGYASETLSSLNACIRKLLRLCYRKKLVKTNVLDYVKNMKTETKDDYKLISKDDFLLLDEYFATHSFIRLGVDNYPMYRMVVNVLYYTGIRCGELLALTPEDFDLEKKRLHVTKAYVSDLDLVKCPKNFKKRDIPLIDKVVALAEPILEQSKKGQRIIQVGHGAVSSMIKSVCAKIGIEEYNCHCFRHTYISNLIKGNIPLPVIEKVSGDTQETILKRYSHMFPSDLDMILDVMNEV